MSLDVAYINPFIRAVNALFGTMLNSKANLSRPRLFEYERDLRPFPTSVEMRLEGAIEGVIAIGFSQESALGVASALLGQPMGRLNADARDALREFGNMVVGQAKAELAQAGEVRMSLPQVTETADVQFPRGLPVLLLPFDSGLGVFQIAVACRTLAKSTPVADAPVDDVGLRKVA